MADIIKEILKMLPEGIISDASYEGANIVLYTKDVDFFNDNRGHIRQIVETFKKRVELRPDPSIVKPSEEAEKMIRSIMPSDAEISNIIFDEPRSEVIIEAEKPGIAIGKGGENLKEIRKKTLWVPLIKRAPALKCELIENIRSVLYQNAEYRRKFLDKVGHRIYDGWQREKKHEWVRLSYLGGARQVGRSCMLVQTPESRILLDCGLDVANEDDAYPYLEAPEFDIKELDAVIVSHSHVDHSGFVPYLFKFGYRGPVYCTAPTRDVMSLLCLDCVKIQRNERRQEIYSTDDVKEMVKHTICLNYGEVTDITPDIRITFYNAGHTIGSAMVHIHVGNGLHNLLYTADIRYGRTNLLEPAHTSFPRLETVMIESTYGGKDNVSDPNYSGDKALKKIILDTFKRNGKVLIPVLGSGRAQEIQTIIEEMVRTKEIDPITVYVDGMVWDITAIHTAYPEYLKGKIRRLIFHKDQNPFLSQIFKQVGSVRERKQILEKGESCVFLATSGMLMGGPSVEYLRALADDDRNSLVFSCYQGEGSLGRRILRGEKEITFREGQRMEVVPIKMEVHRIEISGHSDRRELMNFIRKLSPRPRRVLVNHGESARCLDLASAIHKQNRVETLAPRNLDCIRIR